MTGKWAVIVVLVLVLTLRPGAVSAAQASQEIPEIPPFSEVLMWLAGGAGVAVLISQYVEPAVWFQRLTSQQRRLVVLGLAVLVPVLARLALSLIPETGWEYIEPWWQTVALALFVYASSQGYHQIWKVGKKRDFKVLQ